MKNNQYVNARFFPGQGQVSWTRTFVFLNRGTISDREDSSVDAHHRGSSFRMTTERCVFFENLNVSVKMTDGVTNMEEVPLSESSYSIGLWTRSFLSTSSKY